MPKYKIGDVAWYASCNKHVYKYIPCPVCYGKSEITVILGNDDRVIVPCSYCEEGYRGPTGTVGEYQIMTKAEIFRITGMEINMCGDKEVVEYRMANGNSSYWVKKENELFDTQEDALKKAEELKAQDEKDENEKSERLKYNNLKSYSWNAGHHLRSAKQAQHDFEYYSKKAVLCKAKTKEVKQG
jgi:hypothetical protein